MSENEKRELKVSGKKQIETESGEPTREGVMFVPDVDISETSDCITLFVDLPGVKKENVSIDVKDDVLTLTATLEPTPTNHQLVHREYGVGGFTRRFTLSERIAQDKLKAELGNGVLTLVLPKAEEHKPRKIQINSK